MEKVAAVEGESSIRFVMAILAVWCQDALPQAPLFLSLLPPLPLSPLPLFSFFSLLLPSLCHSAEHAGCMHGLASAFQLFLSFLPSFCSNCRQ